MCRRGSATCGALAPHSARSIKCSFLIKWTISYAPRTTLAATAANAEAHPFVCVQHERPVMGGLLLALKD
eukprot:scaffold76587_cov73-Phaeocystis_antarctica.AAC.1